MSSELATLASGELERRYRECDVQRKHLLRQIVAKDKAMNRRQAEKEGLQKRLRQAENEMQSLYEAHHIQTTIDPLLVELQERITQLRTDAEKETITKAEDKRFRAEIEGLGKELKNSCKHPLVFSYDGHEGSYSYDYEDQYCGVRLCAICGTREQSVSSKRDEYVVLTNEGRLIKRDLRSNCSARHLDWRASWEPLALVKQLFLDAVGKMNISKPRG